MHACDPNMTGSSVINGLLKRSPWRHPTFSRDANSRRMMNQLREALAPISLHVIQRKYFKWHIFPSSRHARGRNQTSRAESSAMDGWEGSVNTATLEGYWRD